LADAQEQKDVWELPAGGLSELAIQEHRSNCHAAKNDNDTSPEKERHGHDSGPVSRTI
jgi:hypothetical protein